MINIKDYLPYYIGCRVMDNGRIAELRGVVDNDVHLCDEETNQYGFGSYNGIKPILRRLSDMSEEELTEAVKLFWGAGNRDIVNQQVFSVKRDMPQFKDKNTFGTAIPYRCLDKDGNSFLITTLSSNSLNPDQFHYLLKQGFDLFGLVDAGLAIDSKTLNQSSMNAKEARQKAINVSQGNAVTQIAKIQSAIDMVVNKGLMSVTLYIELLPSVYQQLINEGFAVFSKDEIDRNESYKVTTISWENQ